MAYSATAPLSPTVTDEPRFISAVPPEAYTPTEPCDRVIPVLLIRVPPFEYNPTVFVPPVIVPLLVIFTPAVPYIPTDASAIDPVFPRFIVPVLSIFIFPVCVVPYIPIDLSLKRLILLLFFRL